MENLGTNRMIEACETALVQIQYFVARDYKLDPQLYRACRADAIHFCRAKSAWASDGMDPERGPLVLPCLYRYAYHPQKNMTVSFYFILLLLGQFYILISFMNGLFFS